jgi:hypothetical protein
MTLGWFMFGVVEAAAIMLLAWLAVRWHERTLRKSKQSLEKTMTIAERVAELERMMAAILAGGSGWPSGLWDPVLKRLEATAEALQMADEELSELSAMYQAQLLPRHGIVGPTSQALMTELARRATLSAHQRVAEAAQRERLRSC